MNAPKLLRAVTSAGEDSEEDIRTVESGSTPPHDPSMDIGERLARVESGLDWIKLILTLIGTLIVAVMIGGFTFLGVQFVRLDGKIDAIPPSSTATASDRCDSQPQPAVAADPSAKKAIILN
jgi:hypothetical protein